MSYTEHERSISSVNSSNIKILMKQYNIIENRLWQIMIVVLIEALGFIGALLTIVITNL